MSIFGFVFFFIYNILFKILRDEYAFPLAFSGHTFSYDDVAFKTFIRYRDVIDDIYNIFSWISVFIDLDLILGLLFLTLLFYGFKLCSKLVKLFLGIFK